MNDRAVTIDRLRAAASAVEEAALPPDLRPAAFVLAYRDEERGDAAAVSHQGTSGMTGAETRDEDPADALRKRLEVEDTVLEQVFDVGSDGVSVILPTRAFSATKREAMAEVILLVVAARQALHLEDWTEAATARRACQDLGVFDRNFAKVLDGVRGQSLRVRGGGARREIKISAAGFEAAGSLAERLVAQLS